MDFKFTDSQFRELFERPEVGLFGMLRASVHDQALILKGLETPTVHDLKLELMVW